MSHQAAPHKKSIHRKSPGRPRGSRSYARNPSGRGEEIDRLAVLAKSGEKAALDDFVSAISSSVTRIARKQYGRVPKKNKMQRGGEICLGIDDLVQEGLLAAVLLLPKYDPALGFRFMTFAARRIRGAMVDAHREGDHLPRLLRQQFKESGVDSPEMIPLGELTSQRGDRPYAFDPIDHREKTTGIAAIESEDSFLGMTRRLDPRYTAALRMYFGYEEFTMKQAAAAIGVSESRVSQWFSENLPIIGRERIAQELIRAR